MHLQLSNEQLSNPGDQLELIKAHEVIGQFIRSCSHGMRGPLKSILGLVNIIGSATPDADTNLKMLLGLVVKVTNNMENQLDEMEHFLENSKRLVGSKLIDWNDLVSNLMSRNRCEIEKTKTLVSVDIQNDQAFYGDRARLMLILNNLLSNAINFRDPSKSTSEVQLQIRATPKECVITLLDNGIGIEERYHNQIFDLFFRASERSSGTGIGLYVVKETVQKMGGTVTVASRPERGTKFTIKLPGRS